MPLYGKVQDSFSRTCDAPQCVYPNVQVQDHWSGQPALLTEARADYKSHHRAPGLDWPASIAALAAPGKLAMQSARHQPHHAGQS